MLDCLWFWMKRRKRGNFQLSTFDLVNIYGIINWMVTNINIKLPSPRLKPSDLAQEEKFWHDIQRRVGMFRPFFLLRNAGSAPVPQDDIVEQITQTREFLEAVDERNLPVMKEILEREDCRILLQTTLNRIIDQFEVFSK